VSGFYFNARLEFLNPSEKNEFYKSLTSSQERREKLFENSLNADDSALLNLFDYSVEGESVIELRSSNLESSIGFYERLVAALDAFGMASYKARLFDSASSGLCVWQNSEEELLDFEGLVVSVVGVDESEGIHDTLEDAGAIVKSNYDEAASVMIYGDNHDLKFFIEKSDVRTRVLHFDDFWDEFEYLSF